MVEGYLVLSEIIRGEEQKKEVERTAGQQQERERVCWRSGWVGGDGWWGGDHCSRRASTLLSFVFASVEMLFGESSQQPADTLETAEQTDSRRCCRVEREEPGREIEKRRAGEWGRGGGSGGCTALPWRHLGEKNWRSTRRRMEWEERGTWGGRRALWWRVFILRPRVSYQLNGLGGCFSTILPLLSPPSRSALSPLSSSPLPRCLPHL